MSKRKHIKKQKEECSDYNSVTLSMSNPGGIQSREELIEIHSLAYYKALKRLEEEKNNSIPSPDMTVHPKKGETLGFIINVLFLPWKINDKYQINNSLHDNLLVIFISMVMQVAGSLLWGMGVFGFIYCLFNIAKGNFTDYFIVVFISFLLLFYGSTFILAGKVFSKETDSHKIYAFSSCVIALISCAIALAALAKM